MKRFIKIAPINVKFCFFRAPEEPFGGFDGEPDPEKQKQAALARIQDLRVNVEDENLRICLIEIEQIILQASELEISDNEGLRKYLIIWLAELPAPVQTLQIESAYTRLRSLQLLGYGMMPLNEFQQAFISLLLETISPESED